MAGTFSLISIGDLAPAIANTPLGDASLNAALATGQITTAAHLDGALPIAFTFEAGGDFSVIALNGKSGKDDAGVVAAADAKTPAGQFTPPLRFDGTHGWLKYIANADVTADAGADVAIVAFTGSAGEQIAMADYHRHALGDGLRTAMLGDLGTLRSAVVLNHVQNLPVGDALAFQTRGELTASLDMSWSDVFTSEISGVARLLAAASPIAIKTSVGATFSVKISVVDSFIVVFAKPDPSGMTVAVRKSDVRKTDLSAGVSISAALDTTAVDAVLDDVVAGLLGTDTDRLKGLLDRLAAKALTVDDHALTAAIVDRLKLAGVDAIDKAVAALKAQTTDRLKTIVESKVRASFAYEYHRVRSDVSVFEGRIPAGGPGKDLHAELIGGNLSAAFSRPPSDIAVTRFMNETSTTVTRAWGFTLGLNKWRVFGQDRRTLEVVERTDQIARTMARSYIGSGGYARTKLEWTADFAADMAAGSASPNVGDYTFGLHLAVVRDTQTFNADDLETALDFAALWSICPESALPFVRTQLAGALNRDAEWSFHLRVNNEALRPMVRVLGSMAPRDFAGAAAAALDATAIPSLQQRRSMYEPLWRAVLDSPDTFNVNRVVSLADALLQNPDRARQERLVTDNGIFDQSTVATVARFDTDWFSDCERFSTGCRLLADAIATPTIDDGTKIPDVYDKLVNFWTQSHSLRTLGAALVDVARSVGQFNGLERTLQLTSGTTTVVVSSNQI